MNMCGHKQVVWCGVLLSIHGVRAEQQMLVLCGWFSDVLPPLRLFVLLSAQAELLMYASPR